MQMQLGKRTLWNLPVMQSAFKFIIDYNAFRKTSNVTISPGNRYKASCFCLLLVFVAAVVIAVVVVVGFC